ncbi:uncharacterized protein RCO7_14753 [Rhynchosporium graminicola]|uniref:Uncharacterized protein n=1 Tax=Rhynchosporium graminicola TaxID=2792576 RepID=A0A1E1L0A8_9HELO|nr:uncharacterized protein RCO7_14753 [Rhynchosporium commune]
MEPKTKISLIAGACVQCRLTSDLEGIFDIGIGVEAEAGAGVRRDCIVRVKLCAMQYVFPFAVWTDPRESLRRANQGSESENLVVASESSHNSIQRRITQPPNAAIRRRSQIQPHSAKSSEKAIPSNNLFRRQEPGPSTSRPICSRVSYRNPLFLCGQSKLGSATSHRVVHLSPILCGPSTTKSSDKLHRSNQLRLVSSRLAGLDPFVSHKPIAANTLSRSSNTNVHIISSFHSQSAGPKNQAYPEIQ